MTKKSKKGSSVATKKLSNQITLTSRLVNVRRHTIGYMAGSNRYTIAQVRKLASSGRVRGVRVVGKHVQAEVGTRRLTDLPMKVVD